MSIDENEFSDSYDLLDEEDLEDDEEDLEDDEEYLEDSDNLEQSQTYAETIIPDGFYDDILEFQLAQSFYQSFLLGVLIVLLFFMGMRR